MVLSNNFSKNQRYTRRINFIKFRIIFKLLIDSTNLIPIMSLIIAVCFLLLFAYLFDITAPKTKIPSFIMLLVMGWIVQQVVVVMGINIIDLTPLLPILGNIGLILIVLDFAFLR